MQLKSSFLAALLFAASFGVAHAAPTRKIVPSGAVSFTSKTHGFAVWLPVKPIEARKKLSVVENRNPAFHTVLFRFRCVRQKLEIQSFVTHKDPSPWLHAFTGSMISLRKIKAQKREEIQIDQFEGLELECLYADGEMIRSRAYSALGDTYLISVNGPEAEFKDSPRKSPKFSIPFAFCRNKWPL